MYININKALENIYEEVDNKVNSLIEKGIQPKAVIIRVDGDPASEIYIRSKVNACKNHNIDSEVITLPNDVTMDKLLNTIEELNIDDTVHGFMLQLPIPEHLDSEVAINKIAPSKDIDCLTKANLGNLFNGDTSLAPCTPAGIISILESNNIEIEGKDVLIINRSMLVGIPLARLLTCKNATVTIAHSKTKNLRDKIFNADIIITAVSKKEFFDRYLLSKMDVNCTSYDKENRYIIDVSTNRMEDGRQCGDVIRDEDFINSLIRTHVTPVPKGVGLTTVASLLKNTIDLIK